VTEARHSVIDSMRASIDGDLLRRAQRTSLIFGLGVGVMFAFYFGLMPASAWMAGIVWSLINLAAIRSLVRNVVTTEGRNYHAIITALALKFPVLYATVVVLLVVLKVPALWWIAGFTWPFFVVLMKSAGRIYLHLDETA